MLSQRVGLRRDTLMVSVPFFNAPEHLSEVVHQKARRTLQPSA